jgi:hypothetical protein
MQLFHEDLVGIFGHHGMDFLENLGRRNIVMSQVMEAYFAKEIAKETGLEVIADGATGRADIIIEEMGKEVECKLNTPHGKRSHALQADWTSLKKKGVDYLYLIANPEFNRFAVLLFEEMGQDFYHPPAPGSRNKVRIRLDKAMDRCRVLHGDAININREEIIKIDKSLKQLELTRRTRLVGLGTRLRKLSQRAVATRQKLIATTHRERQRFDRKREKLLARRHKWEHGPGKWSFDLLPILED